MDMEMIKRGPAQILIAGDKPEHGRLAAYLNEIGGYLARRVGGGRAALHAVRSGAADLVIADLHQPGTNGVRLCAEMRQATNAPVLLLSDPSKPEEIISGLESGADDYIAMPWDPALLAAKIKALLRHSARQREKAASPVYEDGRLRIDFGSCEVWIGSAKVALALKERKLLLYLASHPNLTISTEQLYTHIWGWDSEADDHTVPVHIFNIRQKIESVPSRPVYIRTVRGFGYQFAAAAQVPEGMAR